MKKTIKFGIFGLGRGSSFYDSILVNDGEIVAVCDMSESKLEAAKKRFGDDLGTYTDFEEFLNHPGLEAVFHPPQNCRNVAVRSAPKKPPGSPPDHPESDNPTPSAISPAKNRKKPSKKEERSPVSGPTDSHPFFFPDA